jgi:hypothetical protein
MNLVYLDHNILDALLKERMSYREPYLDCLSNTILYSDETLREIRKSTGYEHEFLEVLRTLKASFLFVESSASGHVTGKWEIRSSDPLLEYDALNTTLSNTSNSNFGLDEIIQKLYGGASERSYSDIAEKSFSDVKNMLDETLKEARNELSGNDYENIALQFESLELQMSTASQEMGELLDSSTRDTNSAAWEASIGVGPLELNNITPPKIVEKVWKMLSPKLPAEATFEKMFGLAAQYNGGHVPTTNIERCNAIYHALNFLGYHRDTRMQKLRRVHASISDMTHVGYASLCNILVSDDKDFCMKAIAVYEYLNIDTQVTYTNLSRAILTSD